MAQPPSQTDIFLREVDENLRRDQMEHFAKKYGKWLIAAVVLFLIAAGGFIYWQQYRQRQAEKQVEQLVEIDKALGTGSIDQAKRLGPLAENGAKAVRAAAKFTQAAVALEKDDTQGATAKYRELANDGSVPEPYRNAALIRQTSLEFDSIKPEEAINRLQPLAKPGNPWFGSAAELTAAALFKQGKKAEAGQLYATIAKDKGAPPTLRARAAQLASSLGVEVGAVLPAAAQ